MTLNRELNVKYTRIVRILSFLSLPVLAVAMAATPARAQQAAAAATTSVVADSLPATPVSPLLVPPSRSPASPLLATAPANVDVTAVQERVRAGSNVAMMGVGAVAIVVGLVIGGDSGMIIATGGAVVGLVGLYRYLR